METSKFTRKRIQLLVGLIALVLATINAGLAIDNYKLINGNESSSELSEETSMNSSADGNTNSLEISKFFDEESKPAETSPSTNLSTKNDYSKSAVTVVGACKIAGCNNELCVDSDEEVFSACTSDRANICLADATCEVQMSGDCGWTYTDSINVCRDGYNVPTKEMRVIEIRYFPLGEGAAPYHPDDLSDELQDYLSEASKFHGYDNPQEPSAVKVNIVDVINVNGTRPNPTGTWEGSYAQMLDDYSLCSRINNEDIDQIWLWVDPVNGGGAPGVEYAISSKHFIAGSQFATIPGIPFCDGDNSFVIMGFDFTRTTDLALHSFGHYMEGLLGNLATVPLFWNSFTDISGGTKNCGNVHFPPNGAADYDYGNTTQVTTNCKDWHPDGSGDTEVLNCTEWGCNQEGYLLWWMQNFPNPRQELQYSSSYIKSWWDYVVDMDESIENTYNDSKYNLNRTYIDNNESEYLDGCSCSGTELGGNPVSTNECGFTVTGEDSQCYRCAYSDWYIYSTSPCP
jgi:hypothetical protein